MGVKGTRERVAILWQRLDVPGHDFCQLTTRDDGAELRGVAVFLSERVPCRLDYTIECDARWITRCARVVGRVGDRAIDVQLERTNDGAWTMNGSKVSVPSACEDIDLGFTPATNLLPIRRLALDIGKSASVSAAWLSFPDFAVEVLEQEYRRTGASTYHYESAGGEFARELAVNDAGFVVDYPELWRAED